MPHRHASGAVRRSDVVRVFTFVVVDIFALYEAFMLAYIQRASAAKPLAHYVTSYGFSLRVAAVIPVWVLVFAVCGLYSSRLDDRRTAEITNITVAVAGGVMCLIVWDYLSINTAIFPSRSIPVWASLYGIVLVLFCRGIVRRAMRLCFARGLGLHNVVLIGAGQLAGELADEMSQPGRGYRIVAAVDAQQDGGRLNGTIPVFGTLNAALQTHPGAIHEITQADPTLDRVEVARMMTFANGNGISYRFVPDLYGVYAAASSATTVGGIPMMELRLTALDGWGAVGKRGFDLILSALLLLAFAPVLLAVAVLIKVTDREGPVLYRHQRVGKNGATIHVLKFRSMKWAYSTGPGRPFADAAASLTAIGRADLAADFAEQQKVSNDPRVSRIGHFLRRSSLDELPQLFNVLLGELSLVGPRPITTDELARYGMRQASFLALKPGITGLWQVSGRSEVTYNERVKLDVFYVENWTLALDMTILARTVRTVAGRKGSY